MDSQLPPSQAVNAYDDDSFIRVDYHSRRERPEDNTCRPIENPVRDRGHNFKPMDLPSRAPVIAALPQQPLLLFQEFLPISLVESWVGYTNSWVSHLLQQHEAGTRPLKPQSRLLTWKPVSVAEFHVWLAIRIYMQIHIEPGIEDYWKVSTPQDYEADHPVTKVMSYNRFIQLSRYLRIFDVTALEKSPDVTFYGQTYSRVKAWSDHIQHTSSIFFIPGTNIAVDECMLRYLGRSHDITTVPNKPTPTGFKVWVVAQQGYFLRWIWHRPGRKFGPVGVRPARRPRQGPQLRRSRQQLRERRTVYLNPTQAVVVALLNLLPASTYHVFLDNLFSSCDLFLRLRQLGYGATGTARHNAGLHKSLVELKAKDNITKGSIPFNELRAVLTADNMVNQIVWKDNALVMFLTTAFTGDERSDRKRKRPTGDKLQSQPIQHFFSAEAVKLLSIPSLAAAYNLEINSVDRGDQLQSYWGPNRRVCRGPWKALAWDFLLEIAIVNSFILQERGQPQWKPEPDQKHWRKRLIRDLMAAYAPASQSR